MVPDNKGPDYIWLEPYNQTNFYRTTKILNHLNPKGNFNGNSAWVELFDLNFAFRSYKSSKSNWQMFQIYALIWMSYTCLGFRARIWEAVGSGLDFQKANPKLIEQHEEVQH